MPEIKDWVWGGHAGPGAESRRRRGTTSEGGAAGQNWRRQGVTRGGYQGREEPWRGEREGIATGCRCGPSGWKRSTRKRGRSDGKQPKGFRQGGPAFKQRRRRGQAPAPIRRRLDALRRDAGRALRAAPKVRQCR